MSNYDDINRSVTRFLENRFSEAERNAFEQRMANDEAFAEAVAAEIVRQDGRLAMKKDLENIRQDLFPSPSPFKRWWWAAAIALILLIPGSWWLISEFQQPPALAEVYFQPYESTPLPRTTGPETLQEWQSAMDLYNSGRYDEALTAIARVTADFHMIQYLADFYSGMCHIAKEEADYPKAIEHLNAVLRSQNPYHEQSWWYLAIVHYESKQMARSRSYFEKLAHQKGSFRQTEAAAILSTYFD